MSVLLEPFMRRIGCKNQQELAERLGITQGAVSAWGSGIRAPRYEDCKRLLEMGMTIEELFGAEISNKINLSSNGELKGDKLDAFLNGLQGLIESLK